MERIYKFWDTYCLIQRSNYPNGNTLIRMIENDSGRILDSLTEVRYEKLNENEVCIKEEYSEFCLENYIVSYTNKLTTIGQSKMIYKLLI